MQGKESIAMYSRFEFVLFTVGVGRGSRQVRHQLSRVLGRSLTRSRTGESGADTSTDPRWRKAFRAVAGAYFSAPFVMAGESENPSRFCLGVCTGYAYPAPPSAPKKLMAAEDEEIS